MKNIYYALLCLVAMLSIPAPTFAQKTEPIDLLTLATYLDPIMEEQTMGATAVLENKLSQIANAHGMTNGYSRFIITAHSTVLTKDVLGTAPARYAYTLNLTLYIGDGIDGQVFSSHTMTVKGVGSNETKAFISAFKNLDVQSPKINEFVSKARTQIVAYYNNRCSLLMKQAQMAANQNQFDEAIYQLVTIPEASNCYEKGLDLAQHIYTQKIEMDCKTVLAQAQNHWNANPTVSGAQTVGDMLSLIDPRSSCYPQVKAFANTVGKRVLQLDGREWKYFEDKEIGLERDRIKAIRDIGVSWGKGQPQNVHYNVRGWW